MLKRYPVKWRQDYRINARKLRDGNREALGKRLRCYLKSCRKWRKISHLLRRRNRRTAAKKQQEQKNYNSKDDITVRLSSFNGFRKKNTLWNWWYSTRSNGSPSTIIEVQRFSYQMKIMKYYDHFNELQLSVWTLRPTITNKWKESLLQLRELNDKLLVPPPLLGSEMPSAYFFQIVGWIIIINISLSFPFSAIILDLAVVFFVLCLIFLILVVLLALVLYKARKEQGL